MSMISGLWLCLMFVVMFLGIFKLVKLVIAGGFPWSAAIKKLLYYIGLGMLFGLPGSILTGVLKLTATWLVLLIILGVFVLLTAAWKTARHKPDHFYLFMLLPVLPSIIFVLIWMDIKTGPVGSAVTGGAHDSTT